MDTETIIMLGIVCVIVVVVFYLSDKLTSRYYRNHPPDGYDGVREDKDDEHEGSS